MSKFKLTVHDNVTLNGKIKGFPQTDSYTVIVLNVSGSEG